MEDMFSWKCVCIVKFHNVNPLSIEACVICRNSFLHKFSWPTGVIASIHFYPYMHYLQLNLMASSDILNEGSVLHRLERKGNSSRATSNPLMLLMHMHTLASGQMCILLHHLQMCTCDCNFIANKHVHISAIMINAVHSSRTSVVVAYRTIWCHIKKYYGLSNHCHEDVKVYRNTHFLKEILTEFASCVWKIFFLIFIPNFCEGEFMVHVVNFVVMLYNFCNVWCSVLFIW
jgi:hypothetical protein